MDTIKTLANDLVTFMEQNDTENHGKRIAKNDLTHDKLVEQTAEMLRTGKTTYIEGTLLLFAECNPDQTAAELLNRMHALRTKPAMTLTNNAAPSLDRRYTLPDEHPCSLCDCKMPGGKCPYEGKDYTEIDSVCRTYLYFQLLQAYENQKFGI